MKGGQKLNAVSTETSTENIDVDNGDDDETEESEVIDSDNDEDEYDPSYEIEIDDESDESESNELEEVSESLTMDGNLRTEPKHIVFLSQLLLLFRFCHTCKADGPLIETKAVGTKAIVTTICSNPTSRQKTTTWHSQPLVPGTKISAGNLLLCMSTLFSGGSISKVKQIFLHMGLGCVSLNTYFRYQKKMFFPTLYLHWKKYQASLLEKAKEFKDGLVLAGDGRHDSMGHSAKYCAYTMFCCSIGKIIHFDLVQRNQAGSSPAMEMMGFKSCMEYLIKKGLTISTFISDRHASIAKYMKTVLKNITHYFDIWHLKKKIRKVLSKIAKEKDCEALEEWIKPCCNHLQWSATSTFDGNGMVIWAKFKSFLGHVTNKHTGHDDPLFNKCAHGDNIPARKWLNSDSLLYEKVCVALTNSRLVKGIKQASPFDQTSCLEGFHSVLNQFSPKMIAYWYQGQYCRHILAVIHFNYNLHRGTKIRKSDNSERLKFTYPKFKNGEATVRNVKVEPDFTYIQEIYQTFCDATKEELKDAQKKLKEMCPKPMDTMLQKQTKAEALIKRSHRRQVVIKDVLPTTPVAQVVAQKKKKKTTKKRADPCCTVCKKRMKGHQFVKDCPTNK